MLGTFSLLDGFVYDHFVRLSPEVRRSLSQVLLVESEPGQPDAEEGQWLNLLEILESQGARQIVFTFLPSHTSSHFYQAAERAGNVVFGRRLMMHPDDPTLFTLELLPHPATDRTLRFGLTQIPPSSYGIHRQQYASFLVDGKTYPALEVVAAQHVLGQTGDFPDRTYLVNFNGGLGTLPRVTLDRVLSGGVPLELVRGRNVLVGFRQDEGSPGLHTSITTGRQMMSIPEFQGLALETLLTGQTIRQLGPVSKLGMLLLIATSSLFVYQFMHIHSAPWLTAGVLVVYALTTWGCFVYVLVWLPIVEISTAQLVLLAVMYRHTTMTEEASIQKAVFTISATLQKRFFPVSFSDDQEHWSSVITIVQHILDLNRTIFLERVAGDKRVHEVAAGGCSISDIHERRRDYTRLPYRTAISENGPIRVEQYLKLVDDQEEQYLVPLVFAGQVLGFWAFGLAPEKVTAIPMFTSIVKNLGGQISELLYHRQQWLMRHQRQDNRLRRYLNLEAGNSACRELDKSIGLLEQRLSVLENVLHGLGTATILYDLFGRVLQVNTRMTDLSQAAQLAPYDMTALDFVAAVTRTDLEQARRVMRHVILEQETLALPASLLSEAEREYVLNIRPVQRAESDNILETGEVHPFQLQGILCSLLDITDMKNLQKLKEQITERLNFQLRSDFESILLATRLLSNEQLPADKRAYVAEILQTKVQAMLATLTEAQSYLNVDADVDTLARYPIDAKAPLINALEAQSKAAALRQVTFQTSLPDLISLVLAAPHELTESIETILALLVQDALEESRVAVSLEEENHWITYHFSNTGFGMPNDRFQEYLFGNEETRTAEFRSLRGAIQHAEQWGGTLLASSEMGVGMDFVLRLRGFI